MAALIGGDIVSIKVDATGGTAYLYPISNTDSTIDYGGVRVEDDDKNITSAGQAINIMHQNRWSFEQVVSWNMKLGQNTLQFIIDTIAAGIDATFTITHINGSVYSGTGMFVGDYKGNGNNIQITVKASGGGGLTQII